MNLREYADRDMLAIDVANMLAGELETALLHHDTVSLAVPGGTTPGPIFDVLCAADLEWDRVHVLPTDERCVPADSDRSNARLITERLLVNRAAKAQFLPLYKPADDPSDVLSDLEAGLAPELPLSVLVLGMGSDMHTASLFPGMPGLAAALEGHAPALAIAQPETQPETRITLTGPVLNGALSKHLVIFGQEKRDVLDRAMSLPPEEAPIAAVLDGITVHWAE
ncbi:6-phosphogluconolactonase [Ruegeria jejuensis]|uniref:6-phosphogluconolactonase n=1 Tax=Ruegeria jejuensis TaxID=3233338 RepID=UPI00355C6312